jgi:ABC-2 type transport system permease protein
MAVHKRNYAAYSGPTTPRWSRFLILTRYSLRSIFQSKIITVLFLLSYAFPLFLVAALYFNHNPYLLSLLRINHGRLMNIDGKFFMGLMGSQASAAFLLTTFVGPGLVSPDLVNNALPLYFSRQLSRTEYVLGRGSVIFLILSAITWIPGVILFFIETNLEGWSWGWDHIQYLNGILVGSLLWIAILALLSLSLSAWVRWKVVAGGLLLGVMFATSAFAAAIHGVLNSNAGLYLDPAALIAVIFANFFEIQKNSDIPTLNACIAMLAICAFCVWLLSRKIRAFQVVR